ncbi:MAG: hypothetical protein WBI63_10225, partial [Coriobacteriia bacterium]
MPRAMHIYTYALCALAGIVTAALFFAYPIPNWLPVVALLLLDFITENFVFELPIAGSVSLAFAVTYAALLHSGPFAAVVCAVAGSTNMQEFREGKPMILRLFNAAQLALSAGLAGLAYSGLGGSMLSKHVGSLE